MSHRKPSWAPKLSPNKIRELYEQDAKGIYDDELIEEVGVALYARCESILLVTSSNLGHPLCIECKAEMPNSYSKDALLVCPSCGWAITAGEYRDSYKHQTLNGVGALPELKEFAAKYPAARTCAERMRLIDALIHAFHGNLSEMPSRPTASNFIEGNAGEVANLIFTLAYGEGSQASAEALAEWLEKFERSITRNVDPATGKLREGKRYLYDGIGESK